MSFSGNASKEDITRFREKIATATSIQIARQSYDQVVSRIPDVELAREYTKCVIATSGFGFFILEETIGDVLVAIKLGYRKRMSDDPMPTVKESEVRGGTQVSGLPEVGSQIEDEFSVSFLRNPASDAILIINTTRESFTYPTLKVTEKATGAVPVGTIVASSLTFEQFRAITKDDVSVGAIWLPHKSQWAPCDGREVPGSTYVRVSARANVPDLRGVFLRGLNQFDPKTLSAQKREQLDPDARLVDSFQADQFQSHTHSYDRVGHTGGPGIADGAGYYLHGPDPTLSAGGAETRPKNVAVYYYIKIN